VRIAVMAVRGLGALALVLGLVLWSGSNPALQGVHMLIGITLVLALWAVAILALRSGVRPAVPVVALAWGVLVFVFGMTQRSIMAGDGHLVVQVAHLLVGLVAIGLGEMLGAASRRTKERAA
jgi:uncharacterized RDD family membrane protein YckC